MRAPYSTECEGTGQYGVESSTHHVNGVTDACVSYQAMKEKADGQRTPRTAMLASRHLTVYTCRLLWYSAGES